MSRDTAPLLQLQEAVVKYLAWLSSDIPLSYEFHQLRSRVITTACNFVTQGEAARDPGPQEITCPLCGVVVKQVASATLSLALWQHVNWIHRAKAVAGDPGPQLGQEWVTRVTSQDGEEPSRR